MMYVNWEGLWWLFQGILLAPFVLIVELFRKIFHI